MKAIGVIPARWQSSRFPGKSVAILAGKPMILRVVERVMLAKRLDAVIVATDDERIAAALENSGACVVMTSLHHQSGTDRVAEAAAQSDADIIVNIQGDEPLIDPDLIDNLTDAILADRSWDMATAAAPIPDRNLAGNPNLCKVVFDSNGKALYFSRSIIPCVRDSDFESDSILHWRHIGIYAYTSEFLQKFVAAEPSLLETAERLEQLRALHIGGRIKVIQTDDQGIGVDTPGDLIDAERLIRERGLS
ncbi:MAG: 3-deoxy-manno-octulosonate cytidylyltransferase [Lentisphaerae bacterium]|nr:3-deoxy-manno-octulosonate cytidylyltransferase [Lentisphaerota bacterium]